LSRETEFVFEELEKVFERQEGGVVDKRIKEIAEHYKYDPQSRQCIEEMAELTKALNKFWRKNLLCGQVKLTSDLVERLKKTPEYKDIVEEVADVQIMLNQIVYLLDMDTTKMVEFKLQRQLERIDCECSN
jgi:NTP pyrophosphatase (non-canonical NTP hydrolase)